MGGSRTARGLPGDASSGPVPYVTRPGRVCDGARSDSQTASRCRTQLRAHSHVGCLLWIVCYHTACSDVLSCLAGRLRLCHGSVLHAPHQSVGRFQSFFASGSRRHLQTKCSFVTRFPLPPMSASVEGWVDFPPQERMCDSARLMHTRASVQCSCRVIHSVCLLVHDAP